MPQGTVAPMAVGSGYGLGQGTQGSSSPMSVSSSHGLGHSFGEIADERGVATIVVSAVAWGVIGWWGSRKFGGRKSHRLAHAALLSMTGTMLFPLGGKD
jgi:hypothetical protein